MAKRYQPERKHEKGMAKSYGLTPTPGSGNTWMAREDAFDDVLLVQFKHTKKKSVTVSLQDILDLGEHARKEGRIPVEIVRFGEEDGVEIDLCILQPHHLQQVAKRFAEIDLVKQQSFDTL